MEAHGHCLSIAQSHMQSVGADRVSYARMGLRGEAGERPGSASPLSGRDLLHLNEAGPASCLCGRAEGPSHHRPCRCRLSTTR